MFRERPTLLYVQVIISPPSQFGIFFQVLWDHRFHILNIKLPNQLEKEILENQLMIRNWYLIIMHSNLSSWSSLSILCNCIHIKYLTLQSWRSDGTRELTEAMALKLMKTNFCQWKVWNIFFTFQIYYGSYRTQNYFPSNKKLGYAPTEGRWKRLPK